MKKSIKTIILMTLVITAMIASASVTQAATLTIGSSSTEIRMISPNKTATIPNKWFPHSRAGLFYVNREYMPVIEGVRILQHW